jgi:electron transfer flavoprotein alpha subunit
MNDPIRTCVVVADDPAVSSLVEIVHGIGEVPLAVVAGRRAVAEAVALAGVREVLWCGEPASGTPIEAYAPAVARLVSSAAPQVVVGAATVAGRALLGAVAAVTGSPVLSGVTSIELDSNRVVLGQECYGGISTRVVTVSGGPGVLAVGGGTISAPGAVSGTPAQITPVQASPLATARVTEQRAVQHAAVDLRSSRTVVGIGRGLKQEADLSLIRELATAVGGELACSRPLAEGFSWMAKERYLGISGQQIAPDLYFAIGISGQLQHMAGVRNARVIVAVNNDRNASVFNGCDYGIVGDLYRIVPAVVAALKV